MGINRGNKGINNGDVPEWIGEDPARPIHTSSTALLWVVPYKLLGKPHNHRA